MVMAVDRFEQRWCWLVVGGAYIRRYFIVSCGWLLHLLERNNRILRVQADGGQNSFPFSSAHIPTPIHVVSRTPILLTDTCRAVCIHHVSCP